MRRALVVAALALAATPAAAAPLESLIRFKDPGLCVPGKDLGRLLDSLLAPGERGQAFVLGVPQVPRAYRRQVGAARLEARPDNLHVATLPMRGTWRGLQVRELYSYATPETDDMGFGIRFDAAPARVRAAANRAGLRIPPAGRRVGQGELDTVVEVKPTPGGAELTCGT
jgi:hypothetical protein